MIKRIVRISCLLAFGVSCVAQAQNPAIQLDVDATHAPERIVHVHERIPVSPGELTLSYPKWCPGEHAPTGSIESVGSLFFRANGKTLSWRRDLSDAFAFHMTVPPSAHTLEVEFSYLLTPAQASPHLMIVRWEHVLLYDAGTPVAKLPFEARLKLPDGWQYASALRSDDKTPNDIRFEKVSLETLVDSPVLAGRYMRKIPLATISGQKHELDVAAETDADLPSDASYAPAFSAALEEAQRVLGTGHFRDYHFLLRLSQFAPSEGLEHHESSDDSLPPSLFSDPAVRSRVAFVLPHEYIHSWNGKFRRPAGLYTSNYQQPMMTDLLWVYEGGSDFLGALIASRSGLWTRDQALDFFAMRAAASEKITGREWRSVQDTADAAHQTLANLFDSAAPGWNSWLRLMDFYEDGAFIWLEADAIIQQQTHGERSLDDFFRAFCSGPIGSSKVKTYMEDDVFSALNRVAPYDWKGFFHARLRSTGGEAPLGGLERSGWRLIYTDAPNAYLGSSADLRSLGMDTIGLAFEKTGKVTDIVQGGPAGAAGLFPGMTLDTINGQRWSPEAFRSAIAAKQPLTFSASYEGDTKTVEVPYVGGLRYSHLERLAGKPDLLTGILGLH